jgi:hypothetical protein
MIGLLSLDPSVRVLECRIHGLDRPWSNRFFLPQKRPLVDANRQVVRSMNYNTYDVVQVRAGYWKQESVTHMTLGVK